MSIAPRSKRTCGWRYAAFCAVGLIAAAFAPQSQADVQLAPHDRYLQTVSYCHLAALAAQAGYTRTVQFYRVPEST